MVVKTYFVYSDDDDRRRRRRRRGGSGCDGSGCDGSGCDGSGCDGSGCDGSWYPSQARNNSLGLVHRYIALITFIIFIFI
jgi:hypothetical protein